MCRRCMRGAVESDLVVGGASSRILQHFQRHLDQQLRPLGEHGHRPQQRGALLHRVELLGGNQEEQGSALEVVRLESVSADIPRVKSDAGWILGEGLGTQSGPHARF